MSILNPDHNMVAKVSDIVDAVNDEYSDELKRNNDMDDIDSLTAMLNKRTKRAKLPIEWFNYDDQRANTDEWISAMASSGTDGNYLMVILWEYNLDGKWGPATFKEMVLKMLEHESIHFEQYARIGLERLDDIESGHQKGSKLKDRTGKERDYMRSYLRDPHELMAYGHDLSEEIKLSSNPRKALRNPEAFINELPVYNQFRGIFPSNAKPLRKMLSYAARYFVSEKLTTT